MEKYGKCRFFWLLILVLVLLVVGNLVFPLTSEASAQTWVLCLETILNRFLSDV